MAPQNQQNNGYGPDGYNSDGYNSHGGYDATYDQDSEYYIDRGQTSETSEQAQQEAEQTANRQEAGDNWIEDLVNVLTRNGRVDEAYNQELTAQARELVQGVEIRQPPPMMCSNYMSVGHPELKTMVTENVDPDGVGEMGDLWIEAGNAMTRFQDGVAGAINNSETDWQGAGGDAARMFMAEVGNWVGTAGQSAQLAGTQTNIQADALVEAKNSMPEPVAFDAAAANRDLQTTNDPLVMMAKYANYMMQYQEQQQAHQQAAQVVGTYDSGLSSASTMPAFAKPPVMANPDGSTSDATAGNIDSLGTGSAGDVNGGTGGVGGTGGSGGYGGGDPSFTLPPPNGTSPDGSGGGSGGGYYGGGGGYDGGGGGNWGGTDPSGGGPDFPGPGPLPYPTPTPTPNPAPGPGGNNPYVPGGPMPMGPGGGPGGPGGGPGGGRFGPAGRGFGPGGGGLGSGGYGPNGAGLGARGLGAMGPGSAGALAAENAAMRGAPGAGGTGGAAGRGGMMGGMGGGRANGEDDEEHQRPSFLVEGDPDAVFGTDEMTAPPVIGE